MIIVIDNYDSFTYNIYQYVGHFRSDVEVVKNDKIAISEIKQMPVDSIIVSPGPGHPKDSKVSLDCINQLGTKVPILGICLGHQAIIENFGGSITNADDICHGKVHDMKHFSNCILFDDISYHFSATRYHSLVSKKTIPDCLEITAVTKNFNEIMGIQHKEYQIFGLQFHPESIETKDGIKMIENFINAIK